MGGWWICLPRPTGELGRRGCACDSYRWVERGLLLGRGADEGLAVLGERHNLPIRHGVFAAAVLSAPGRLRSRRVTWQVGRRIGRQRGADPHEALELALTDGIVRRPCSFGKMSTTPSCTSRTAQRQLQGQHYTRGHGKLDQTGGALAITPAR